MQGKKDSEQKVVCDTELVNQIMEYLQGISEVKSYNLLGKQAKRLNDANEACEKINTKMEMLFVPLSFSAKRDNQNHRCCNRSMQCIFLY